MYNFMISNSFVQIHLYQKGYIKYLSRYKAISITISYGKIHIKKTLAINDNYSLHIYKEDQIITNNNITLICEANNTIYLLRFELLPDFDGETRWGTECEELNTLGRESVSQVPGVSGESAILSSNQNRRHQGKERLNMCSNRFCLMLFVNRPVRFLFTL
jgi:hypothetical protein